jgi:S1-C subfamily serine protease
MSYRASLALAVLILTAAAARAAGPEDSVVKVFSVVRAPNPIRPWARQNPIEISGSGVVIEGRRVLTNAHLVLYAGEVSVQARHGGKRFEAQVEAIGPGIDLAVLRLDDESFFRDRPPLSRAVGLPEVTAGVAVYGYPIGGTGLSITRGVVSRINYDFLDDSTAALQIQVDAAINPGNSGGPALVDGRMIGLVYGQDESIGYLLAGEEIDSFLADVKDGRYDGKPHLLDHFQGLENPALRARLGLADGVAGIMVRKPARADGAYPLREGDVITRIGDRPIDDEGMVQVGEDLRLPFVYLVPKLARDGSLPLGVLRAGKTSGLDVPVAHGEHRLIRDYTSEPQPYLVCGPLVFSPVLSQAIPVYYRANPLLVADMGPMATRRFDRPRFPGEELVVVTAPLLPHRMTRGYGDPFGQVVRDVDGVEVKGLRHLVELLRDGRGEFLTFRFAGELSETLVFRREEFLGSTAELMAANGIPRQGTDDVLAVWSGKPSSR